MQGLPLQFNWLVGRCTTVSQLASHISQWLEHELRDLPQIDLAEGKTKSSKSYVTCQYCERSLAGDKAEKEKERQQ
jgi:hypothetical protein